MGFNSRLDLNWATMINFDTMDEWEFNCSIIDNSSMYFPSDARVNDIIYINNYDGVKRYIVTSITKATNSEFIVNVKWDMPGHEPFEPTSGYEGAIGRKSDKLGLTSLPSWSINGISEGFINSVKNYELSLIEKTAVSESPSFTGKPLAPTAPDDSNDLQIANTEWVNNKLKNFSGGNDGAVEPGYCKGEVKTFQTDESISMYDVVYLTNYNKIKKADANNIDCSSSVIGIAMKSADINNDIEVLMEGTISNSSWDFKLSGETLFVGENGQIATKPSPNHKFMQQIGISTNSNTINLEIEESILL